MRRVIARIELKRTEEGGRRGPFPSGPIGLPAFFEDVPALSAHGYELRLEPLNGPEPEWLSPGAAADAVVRFLSEEELLPRLRPGVRFRLWEGRDVGLGTVIRVEDAP